MAARFPQGVFRLFGKIGRKRIVGAPATPNSLVRKFCLFIWGE